MTSPEAMALACKEIPTVLASAGLVDGDALDSDEERRDGDNRPAFWAMRAERPSQTSRETFVVWKYATDEPIDEGDDDSDRKVRCYIDIWSLESFDSPGLIKLAKIIAKKAKESGWQLEPTDSPYYDNSSQRTLLSYSAEKVYQ